MLKRNVISTIMLMGFVQILAAAPLSFSSSNAQVNLLELYTSEGCSSCPPADRWVSSLKNDPKLWKEFIPLGFHVYYWDYIGWRDRFASPVYSRRQQQYAQQGSVTTVYTPGFLNNGKEWRPWKGRRFFGFSKNNASGVLNVRIDGAKADIRFRPSGVSKDNLDINVALLGFELSSRIKSGENTGRILHHDFVVLALYNTELKLNNDEYVGAIGVPTSKILAPRYAVVLWVTPMDYQSPIQAVGGWLP